MTKNSVLFIIAGLLLAVSPGLRAADCISADVELASEVIAGEIGRGSFELTNCGDLGGTAILAIALQIPNGPTIEVGAIEVELAAGETVTRGFNYPAPHLLAGYTFGVCMTAVMGEATSADCAATTIVGGSAGAVDEREGFDVALALQDDCLEMDLEISDTIYTSLTDYYARAYLELTNCGDVSADIELKLNVTGYDLSGTSRFRVSVGAGETVSREWTFTVPPYIPSGQYLICVTAVAGTALAADCETVEVLSAPRVSGSEETISALATYPNPFNPNTRISFSLKETTRVSAQVVNLLGQRVRLLAQDETMAAGDRDIVWDGCDDFGRPVSSGIYFWRIVADDQTVSEKMVLIK